MLQQNLYNENNRYLKWVFSNFKLFFDIDIFLVVIALVLSTKINVSTTLLKLFGISFKFIQFLLSNLYILVG